MNNTETEIKEAERKRDIAIKREAILQRAKI